MCLLEVQVPKMSKSKVVYGIMGVSRYAKGIPSRIHLGRDTRTSLPYPLCHTKIIKNNFDRIGSSISIFEACALQTSWYVTSVVVSQDQADLTAGLMLARFASWPALIVILCPFSTLLHSILSSLESKTHQLHDFLLNLCLLTSSIKINSFLHVINAIVPT